MKEEHSTVFDSIPIKQKCTVIFDNNKIILKGSPRRPAICNSTNIMEITNHIKSLHNTHIKEVRLKNFDNNVHTLLKEIAKEYIDEYLSKKETHIPLTPYNWEKTLISILDEVKNQIKKTQYIKIINSFITVEEHAITIMFRNTENNRILQDTLLIVDNFEVTINTKIGSIVFE